MLFSISALTTVLSATLLSGSVANAAPVALEERAVCATDVHIIVARGSTEMPGEGSMMAVSDKIKALIPGSTSVGVEYPALLIPYIFSQTTGAAAMEKAVNDYAAACPKTKIVLMGYSQGAQIVGDVLNGDGWGRVKPTAVKTIAAVIQIGDASWVVGTSGNKGTSTRSGIFPRQDTSKVKNFNVQSYCDKDDPVCSSPGLNLAVHLGYVNKYSNDMVAYVVEKAKSFVI